MPPRLTVIIAAIRPQFWRMVWENLAENQAEVRLIFSGPLPPISPLPPRVEWIPEEGTPTACWNRAARAVETELVMESGDDVYFTPGALDRVVGEWDAMGSPSALAGFRYVRCATDMTAESMRLVWEDADSPTVLLAPVMRTAYRQGLGGHDLSLNLLGGIDLTLRATLDGAPLHVSEDATLVEPLDNPAWADTPGYVRATSRFYAADMARLRTLWQWPPLRRTIRFP